MRKSSILIAISTPLVSFAAVGCGGSTGSAASSVSVVTVAAEPSTVTAAPSLVTVTAANPTTAAPPTASEQSSSSAPSVPAGAVTVMPDVVCQNLQDAQDEIQRAGVFFSRSDDASGKGRAQVLDRNWIVVSQTPAPGSPVSEGEAILSVVKIGEPAPC